MRIGRPQRADVAFWLKRDGIRSYCWPTRSISLVMRRAPAPRDEMLTCAEVGRLLQRFLDGELDDPATTGALDAHLDVCEPCGLEADVYRDIKAALRAHRADVGDASVARLRGFGERLMEH